MVVHDENLPRGFWKLGRIEEIIAGRDGRIRGVKVRLASRNQQQTQLHRPIQLLYPLEIRDDQLVTSVGPPNGESQNSSQETPAEPEPQREEDGRRRSKRISAWSTGEDVVD